MIATLLIAVSLSANPVSVFDVTDRVEKGEEVWMYVGVPMPTETQPNSVWVKENKHVANGLWFCFKSKGEAKMTQMPLSKPAGKPKRIVSGGYYYDLYPDGWKVWCVACNRGR